MNTSELMAAIREEIRRQVQVILHGETGTNTAEDEDIANLVPGMPTITARPVMHPYGFASRAPAGTIQVIGRVGEHASNRFVLGHRAADRPADLEVGETALYSADGDIIYVRNGSIVEKTKEYVLEAETSAMVTAPEHKITAETSSTIETAEHVVISDSIKLGSDSSSENIPLGQVLKSLLSDILTQVGNLATEVGTIALNVSTHTHVGGVIPPPDNAAAFTASQTAALLVNTQLTLLKSSQVESEAILSQRAFTEE